MKLILAIMLAMLSLLAFGQEIPVPSSDEWSALLLSLGGMKGMGALGIAAFITQAVMLFWRTELSNFSGQFRYLIFMGLSLVSAVIALLVAGLDWAAIMTHATVWTAIQNFGHQVYKQFFEKKA